MVAENAEEVVEVPAEGGAVHADRPDDVATVARRAVESKPRGVRAPVNLRVHQLDEIPAHRSGSAENSPGDSTH